MKNQRIKGVQKTSLLDFPGFVAFIIFFGGCNMRCPFCHNPDLIPANSGSCLDVENVLADIAKRRQFIDGVVLTGGEPTIQPDLAELIGRIKGMGLHVKLDTNGLRPDIVQALIRSKQIDYVALDVKTAPSRYTADTLGCAAGSQDALIECFGVLSKSATDYEIRTTCVPDLVQSADIQAIGHAVRGVKRWVLQQFHPDNSLSMSDRKPYSPDTIEELVSCAEPFAQEVIVRGL